MLAGIAGSHEPLAVLVCHGAGFVLHSVAHWFQHDADWYTELEALPAGRLPAFAPYVCDRPALQVGDVLAAMAMSSILGKGLELALSRRLPRQLDASFEMGQRSSDG